MLLAAVQGQLAEALTTDKDAMSSTLVHEGEDMVFEIEEFKIRIKERERTVSAQLQVKHTP